MKCKNIFDTWVLTDGMGRSTPNYKETGPVNGREVGLFYFLWHDHKKGLIYDHYKTYLEGGINAVREEMQQGPLGYAHYWAEPYFGYYQSTDEWIIRKHCYMLSAAGVDFIFFDTSNGHYFEKGSPKIFEVFSKMKEEGVPVPKIVYFNGDNPDLNLKTIMGEYELIYSKGLYKDLWYLVDGKPLMLCNPEKITDEKVKEFFTIRKSWAFSEWDWYSEREGKNCWPWIDFYPQGPGLSPEGEVEQVIVSCGFHANGSTGRSYHNGKQPDEGRRDFGFGMTNTISPHGLAFEEQFKGAMEIGAPRMMITGWNEWWAGRWDSIDAQDQLICKTYIVDHYSSDGAIRNYYVDNLSPEYSRDIEPMKGGFKDNYYCQMVEYNRKYKGTNPIPVSSGKKTIDLSAGLSQWDDVGPEYLDFIYDTAHRDYDSFGGSVHYENNTGRNDIEMAKVSRDNEYVYFLVKTMDVLTKPEGSNWMNLFINVEPNWRNGWEGYTILVNRFRNDDCTKASIEETVSGWNWVKMGEADIVTGKNFIMLKMPLSFLKMKDPENNISFEFKWADNSVIGGEIMDFYDKGDAAPDGRFNFRYCEK
ncbi:MAG: hypothetical protein LBI03_09760 [Clostridiales bacterium]|jgi:hypothetical protein|nr:hypothetical protein [Clostridiales bacterium]